MDFVTYLVYKDYIPFQVGLNLLRTCIAEEHMSQLMDEMVLRHILSQTQVNKYHDQWEVDEHKESAASGL
ncbi:MULTISPECIES: hypothetical protein [unclassified Oceanispirochaeta]|uniref:hypothetical protein n=1 Tax=unclassified Oceanispirochaeta TaxID=2635722 RepID=UPI000E09097B|nr:MULTISPECIES: hypothetical protein [unclassified Oceanispirochaeta]MBF9014880.1 hypothetical protein [Oceanispirochaeta sp. M2]NPD71439.1 hypothetical protein [Oceanispirochaeta sp. M1]RDG33400.1 hypothetical protein DV872_04925 [Oceanispirochaeta sp. M1]